jgi:methylthioxylose transferase
MTTAARTRLTPLIGVFVAVGLIGLAMVVPALTGWHVHVNSFPPLHAEWDPRVGVGTLPALVVGGLAAWWSVDLARRLPWPRLLLATYGGGLAWLFSLALVDGKEGIGRILDTRYEYLRTARATTDLPATLREYVSRISFDGLADDIEGANWPPHIAGHPPGALSFFVLLVRVGLGSGLAAGIVITLIAASTAVAVLITLRLLGAETAGRQAAPILVFGPAAIWQAVSADAMFAAVAAWGIAALAAAATRRSVPWALAAGLLLGYCVMLSYGLPLLSVLAVAVLVVARNWRPLPWAVLSALAVVLTFAALGFLWWEALPVLRERYWDGVADVRPASYWLWGNLGALVFSAGPLVGAGLGMLIVRTRELDLGADAVRVVRWLAGAGLVMVLIADGSLMSKAEVERIWLPFVPWLLMSCALLPERWRRIGVLVQVVFALVVQHLLFTGW